MKQNMTSLEQKPRVGGKHVSACTLYSRHLDQVFDLQLYCTMLLLLIFEMSKAIHKTNINFFNLTNKDYTNKQFGTHQYSVNSVKLIHLLRLQFRINYISSSVSHNGLTSLCHKFCTHIHVLKLH
jgi:hypothetical protein